MKLKSFLKSQGTQSEYLFYVFAMGAVIGLIIATLCDPFWLQREERTWVFYAMGTVIVCLAKLATLRIMMVTEGVKDG